MRPLDIVRALLLASVCFNHSGCSEPAPEPLRFKVGVHDVSFDAPRGWQQLDEKAETLFRNGIAQIYLNDTGPVTIQGFQREIERARELFRQGELAQVGIATQRPLIIDQRSALLIDTWDRLNHTQPKRYIFVLNEGNFLVIRTGLGPFADIEPVFDALTASLRIRHANATMAPAQAQ